MTSSTHMTSRYSFKRFKSRSPTSLSEIQVDELENFVCNDQNDGYNSSSELVMSDSRHWNIAEMAIRILCLEEYKNAISLGETHS